MERAARPVTETPEPRPVLIISNHAEIVGGGEISLLTLLHGLDRSHWSPLVVVPVEGEMAAWCRRMGLATYVIPLPELRWPGLALLRSLVVLIRVTRRTNAVLLHANGSRAMFYAGLAGRLLGRPVIWHLRVWRPDPWLDRLLTKLATRTIAVSEVVKARLRPWPQAHNRCVIVPNGLDLKRFRPERTPETIRASLCIPMDTRIVGTVGRLVALKGQHLLLEAFIQIHRHFADTRLLVVGDGEERERLEQRVRVLGITEAVLFTGHRADVADLLSVMDVFVLPSLAEEFGRVLLEAMAIERPVVATASGGVPEVVEEHVTGLLVRPSDPTAIADAVGTLLANPIQARAMGQAGRQRVEKYFQLDRHARLVESVYREAVVRADP